MNKLTTPPLKDVLLDLPYFSQLNNLENPYGACGPTAIAMAASFLGIESANPEVQLEDEFYRYMIANGLNRHVPEDLAVVLKDYGLKDIVSRVASLEDAVIHLQSGNPIVIAGYFTDFGHQIAGCGVKFVNNEFEKGKLIVHDPYGEYFRHGYNNAVTGKFLHYSFGMIRRLCMDDGYLWLHRISA